jgi:hypothetical protein
MVLAFLKKPGTIKIEGPARRSALDAVRSKLNDGDYVQDQLPVKADGSYWNSTAGSSQARTAGPDDGSGLRM